MVFLKKGHGDGEDLFEFKTDEGTKNCCASSHCTFVFINFSYADLSYGQSKLLMGLIELY